MGEQGVGCGGPAEPKATRFPRTLPGQDRVSGYWVSARWGWGQQASLLCPRLAWKALCLAGRGIERRQGSEEEEEEEEAEGCFVWQ